MDSLTQIVLGSSVAAVVAPARQRRPAIVAGAVLGTLPDLDVIWFKLAGSNAITELTWHRGPSHSLFVLTLLACGLWLVARRYSPLVQEAPRRWFWLILLALVTHPLLDAFTVYGTQLLWPLPGATIMWGSIFIVDPQIQRLLWFSHGFVGLRVARDGNGARQHLILSDLRMGLEPDYVFRYHVADRQADGHWTVLPEVRRQRD